MRAARYNGGSAKRRAVETRGISYEVRHFRSGQGSQRHRRRGVDDISQTIMNEIFTMTMLVTLDPEVAGFNEVQEKLDAEGEELGVQIILQREDVFQYMYKI